ncbi:MAG TPA: hypothetical protein VD905_04980 [Flavobacteriales bacterium]|nr:hypothetical protein [Flavobacteriales bacterium]
MKTDTGYVFTVNWEFVNDTIFDVKQIGKKDSWVYVYGNYGQLHKPCWLHIADYGDIVKHYCRWVENEVSHYGRQNADMYIPEEAIDKLACSN